jgi:hypothetical protein
MVEFMANQFRYSNIGARLERGLCRQSRGSRATPEPVGALFPLLEVDERADALCERLLRDCGLPARASIDAAHVAVAAVHDMEFLLTWNFAHLVNTNFAPRIRSVCELQGHSCPLICTPEQLMERYEHAHTG